jgi:Na+-transporting NADH:ubiquinone oxidoreductase, subunit NqrA
MVRPRAYVVTGQYEKVMPMDIMPQQLIKAVMAKDLELMESLGILRSWKRIWPFANLYVPQN